MRYKIFQPGTSYPHILFYLISCISYLLILLVVSQRAYIVALCDALGQIQLGTISFADAVVAAHGDVTESCNFFVGAAGLLPCLYQRAVVEIDIQFIVGGLQHIHLKNQLSGLGEQHLLQTLQAVGIALLDVPCAVVQAAAADGGIAEFLPVEAALAGFVTQQVQPVGTMLQLLADGNQQRILILCLC